VGKKKLLQIIMVFILIVLVVIGFYPYIAEMLDLYNPLLGDKYKLVRYYACSLAICTKGCGSTEVGNICVDYDAVKGECYETCQDICDNWEELEWPQNPNEGHKPCIGTADSCDVFDEDRPECEDHSGCEWCGCGKTETSVYGSDKFYCLEDASKEDCDPKHDTARQSYGWVGCRGNPVLCNQFCDETECLSQSGCSWIGGDCESGCGENYAIKLPLESKVRLKGCYKKQEHILTQYGGSRVYLTEIADVLALIAKREPDFPKITDIMPENCFQRWAGNVFETHMPGMLFKDNEKLGTGRILLLPNQAYETFECSGYDDNDGFYECNFIGNLEMRSFPDDGCVDVIIRDAGEPFTGGFTIDVPKEVTIPKDITDSFPVMITNNLGEEYGDATCEPTEYPPGEYYTIEIKVWDGSIPDIEKVELSVGKLTVYVNEEHVKESEDITIGSEKTFDVYVRNELGRDATILDPIFLDIPDLEVNCTFNYKSRTTSLTVLDEVTGKTTMVCKPKDAAKGNTYDVIVTAEYDVLKDDDIGVKITVPKCVLTDLELKFRNSKGEISAVNQVNSGDTFTLRATGFTGCAGLGFKGTFSVYEEGLKIDSNGDGVPDECTVGSSGDVCDFVVHANSPDTYTFFALMDDMNGDGVDETDSGSLTIGAGPRSGRGSDEEECRFYKNDNDICEYCTGWIFVCTGYANCKEGHCLDPQTCRQRSAASVCCLDDKNYYCNGPGCDEDTGESNVPCFSTDTITTNARTEDIWYGGSNPGVFPWQTIWWVENPRNVLVDDTHEAKFIGFKNCDSDDCTGGSGGPSLLSSAWCEQMDVHKKCKLLSNVRGYFSWEFIKISSGSRPVYGIMIKIRGCGGKCPGSEWDIYLHEKDGNWFNITKDDDVYSYDSINSKEIYLRPENEWAWENIDAMLIGFIQSDFGYVDYVGLLTKGADIPYCTDGTGDYNRVVDDGKKCFWGVDCETGETDVTGFNSDGVSDGVGPLKEYKCDCSSGTCGEGYCHDTIHGIDYSNVRCAHGGWRGDKV